jgi:hypothetical protein
MLFFIILLAVSQIVSFFLIFNKIKPFIKPKTEGIVLKLIPDKPTYESLDPSHKLVYDVMESTKLENWKVEITPDISYSSESWEVNFESQTGIRIRSRIRSRDKSLYLISFTVINGDRGFTNSGSISIHDDSKIKDDVVSFIWSYIIEYHENENEETRLYYQSIIDNISSKLKTLRRSEKLNNILEL